MYRTVCNHPQGSGNDVAGPGATICRATMVKSANVHIPALDLRLMHASTHLLLGSKTVACVDRKTPVYDLIFGECFPTDPLLIEMYEK